MYFSDGQSTVSKHHLNCHMFCIVNLLPLVFLIVFAIAGTPESILDMYYEEQKSLKSVKQQKSNAAAAANTDVGNDALVSANCKISMACKGMLACSLLSSTTIAVSI